MLGPELVEKWADETKVSSVWKSRRLIFSGRLIYKKGGKLARIEAETVRERDGGRVTIQDLLDPEFTAGFDPVAYIERLHEGGGLARRVYWDSCVFIGLIMQEAERHPACLSVWREAEAGDTLILTSFFTWGEVFKAKCDGPAKPLTVEGDIEVEQILAQRKGYEFFVILRRSYL